MHPLARPFLVAWTLLVVGSVPARAQRRVQLDASVPTAGTPGTVTTVGLFADPDMRDLVRSGFPLSLRFRLELWRTGGLFDDLEGSQEWELIVQYDPSGQRYRVVRRQSGRMEIQPVAKGKSDSQNSRFKLAQRMPPVTERQVCSMWWWLFQ